MSFDMFILTNKTYKFCLPSSGTTNNDNNTNMRITSTIVTFCDSNNNPNNGWQDPPSRHVYCVRHNTQNFTRQFKVRDLRKKVINMDNDLNLITIIFTFFF
jgi:hypothetical protein